MSNIKFSNLGIQSLTRIGAALLIAVAIGLPACTAETQDETVGTEPDMTDSELTEDAQSNVTTSELTDNLSDYLGETVTIRNEVDEVIGDYAFLMNDDELFGGEEILVINASAEAVPLVEGEETQVQATGEVRELILQDLEAEYGFDLDDNLFADYEQTPVIVAQSIALAPDPEDISAEPEDYYYRRIAVNGEVESVLGSGIVTIEEDALFGGEDLLVISPEGDINVVEDEEIVMTGELRPFIAADIERDYELGWDLDFQQEIEAEYQDRPVLIADSVYPSAM